MRKWLNQIWKLIQFAIIAHYQVPIEIKIQTPSQGDQNNSLVNKMLTLHSVNPQNSNGTQSFAKSDFWTKGHE